MTSPVDDARARAFILANTRKLRPPLVPEIELHLAEESLPIWRKSEEELSEMNVPPPYWAFAWAGGQALARYVLDRPDMVAGKAVLDLGSGSGLVAIAAAMAGAGRVTANEIDPFALAACRLNALASRVSISIDERDLIASALEDNLPEHHDVVLLADVFYEKPLVNGAMAIAASAHASGAEVLAGDPQRSFFPEDRFGKVAEYAVPVTRELEDFEIKNTSVWKLLR